MNAGLIPRTVLLMLFGLMLALLVPQLDQVPWWILPVYAALGLWRYQIYRGVLRFPAAWAKFLVVAGIAGLLRIDMGSWQGLEPMVALLLLAFALKLLELIYHRDAYVLVFVAYFLVATQFLFSQSLSMTFFAILEVWWITAILMALHVDLTVIGIRAVLKRSGILLAQAVPLMLVIFFIFPRLDPFWAVPIQSNSGVTGVSDRMNPGDIANLTRSAQVAFRAKFEGESPSSRDLYWRALVLDRQVGNTWTATRPQLQRGLLDSANGDLSYSLTMASSGQRWIPVLKTAKRVGPGAVLTSDYTAVAVTEIKADTRFEVVSELAALTESALSGRARDQFTQLTGNINPKSRALARQWLDDAGSAKAYVEQILAFFRTEPFYYTLNPPVLGRDGVDAFLFETRRGFCEHYAGAFTELMRAAGIPSRVVTGYQGGELNPLNQTIVVRQYDAHAWSEVWFEDGGWVRIDPTAAVAPDRIEYGLEAALAEEGSFLENTPLSPLRFKDSVLINSIRLRLDALTYQWQSWVLGFDKDAQTGLLQDWLGDFDPWKYGFWFALAWVLSIAPPWLVSQWRAYFKLAGPERVYLSFEKVMRRLGLERQLGETLLQYRRRLIERQPDCEAEIADFIDRYSDWRYLSNRGEESRGLVPEMKGILREMRSKLGK